MLADIQDAINKNLPTQVGEALKKRLEEADKNDRLIVEYKAEETRLRAEVSRLKNLDDIAKTFATRESALVKAERVLEIAQAVSKVRDEVTGNRLADLKEVVLAVFANSKFKYKEEGCNSSYTPAGSNNTNLTKTIISEG